MIIKVCGMRDADNIRDVEALGVDWIGMIFWPHSSRYVNQPPTYLPTKAKRVGVFVDEDIEVIRQKAGDYALDRIQLHGQESPAFTQSLRSLCGDSVAIIKAFNIATAADLAQTKPYEGHVDYFLFDTKAQLVGGNGTKFDWTVLADYVGDTPFLLSGGIGPDDAERLNALRTLDGFPIEKCIGIDLNSRFETAPALKDINTLRTFIKKVRL